MSVAKAVGDQSVKSLSKVEAISELPRSEKSRKMAEISINRPVTEL